jgi:hypothetical protein
LTGPVTIGAGTASIQPILLTSGTNLTTAVAGSIEYDGSVGYFTSVGVQRGVWMAEQIAILAASYTLTSQTAAQKMFDTTVSPNGAISLSVGFYEFECGFGLSSMSTTSGSFGWTLGGAATFTTTWISSAKSGTAATAGTANITYNTGANTSLVTANTTGLGQCTITGIISVTVAGTIIPQISLTVAAAAVVATNSYFKIRKISGTTTAQATGNWS